MHFFQPSSPDQQQPQASAAGSNASQVSARGQILSSSHQLSAAVDPQLNPLAELDSLRMPASTIDPQHLTTRQALRIYGKMRDEIIAHRLGELDEQSMTVGARLTLQALTYQDTKNAVQLRNALASVPDADGFTKAFGFATGIIARWRAQYDELEDRALTRSLPWHLGAMAYHSAMTAVGTVGTMVAGVLLNLPQPAVVNAGFVVAVIGVCSVKFAFLRMCQAGYIRQQFAINLRAIFTRAAQGVDTQDGDAASDSENRSFDEQSH